MGVACLKFCGENFVGGCKITKFMNVFFLESFLLYGISLLCLQPQVILSKEQKQLILNTVSNFDAYKRCRKKMGLDDAITYGAGMVMLFHGPPGTGKTMMANALANKLNKKVSERHLPAMRRAIPNSKEVTELLYVVLSSYPKK